jgi:phosphoglycolate phosphatase
LKYSHLIWDWNGTLLDDVNQCIAAINQMLSKRELKAFADIHEYHKVFGFPIVDYYLQIGFDFEKEPFEDVAVEFIALYLSNVWKLHENAEQVLRAVHEKGVKQVILSASEINNLKAQLAEFDIEKYFDEILGISDIYAGSKTEIGLEFISRNKIKSALLIGDTERDLETANKLGADCVLIANGHQSKEKLLTLGVAVLNDINDVLELLC